MTDWRALADELARWSDSGATATFWWRDDDAVTPTPQLDALLQHAEKVPLALAVIPAAATTDLPERLRDESSVVVLQHGWRHTDHTAGGKNEYPAWRPEGDVAQEFALGRALLAERFVRQFISVFVPPWHNLDDRFLPLLPLNGIGWISRRGPRAAVRVLEGLRQANAHVAPIRWTAPPSFGDESEHLAAIVQHLRGRRLGTCDSEEPTGLLTHHLVESDASYAFIARLGDLIERHPAARWVGAREIFAS